MWFFELQEMMSVFQQPIVSDIARVWKMLNITGGQTSRTAEQLVAVFNWCFLHKYIYNLLACFVKNKTKYCTV